MLGFEPIAAEPIASHYQIQTGPNLSTTYALAPMGGAAELLYFGQPFFTVSDTGTDAALLATASPGGARCVRVMRVDLTFSKAPTAGAIITILDGATVIYKILASATGRFQYTVNFSKKPLHGTSGNDVSVTCEAAGAGCVQTISFSGDYVRSA